jgi:hypothetical protein
MKFKPIHNFYLSHPFNTTPTFQFSTQTNFEILVKLWWTFSLIRTFIFSNRHKYYKGSIYQIGVWKRNVSPNIHVLPQLEAFLSFIVTMILKVLFAQYMHILLRYYSFVHTISNLNKFKNYWQVFRNNSKHHGLWWKMSQRLVRNYRF